jgi:hypothetical protein
VLRDCYHERSSFLEISTVVAMVGRLKSIEPRVRLQFAEEDLSRET